MGDISIPGELSPWSLPVLKVANDIWVYLLHRKKTSKYRKTCQRGSALFQVVLKNLQSKNKGKINTGEESIH